MPDLPGRKPAYYSLSLTSTSFFMRCIMTERSNFPGTESKVMSLQLLKFVRSPVFGNLITKPFILSLRVLSFFFSFVCVVDS